MPILLTEETERLLVEQMRLGGFSTPDEAIRAGLAALQAADGEFASGELDHLLAEGEASGDLLDGEAVLAELRELRRQSSRQAG